MINTTPLHPQSLAEVDQTHDIKFAHVRHLDNEYQILHNPAKCREFLNDYANFLWRDQNGLDRYTVYGYTVKKESDQKNQLMWWKMVGKLLTNFKANLHILHQLEEELGTTKTEIVHTDDNGIIIKYDPFWEKVTFLFTYHTLILKLCAIMPKQKNLDAMMEYGISEKFASCNEKSILNIMYNQYKTNLNKKLKSLKYDHPTGNKHTPCAQDHAWGIGMFCQFVTNKNKSNKYVSELVNWKESNA